MLVFAYHLVGGRLAVPREAACSNSAAPLRLSGVRGRRRAARPAALGKLGHRRDAHGHVRRAARPLDEWLGGRVATSVSAGDWQELPAYLEWEA